MKNNNHLKPISEDKNIQRFMDWSGATIITKEEQEINAILKTIMTNYRKNYDGDYFLYECVDRDVLLAICQEFKNGNIDEKTFHKLIDFTLVRYIENVTTNVWPIKKDPNAKIHLKYESMSVNELRIEVEDAFSKLEDIEQLYKEGKMEFLDNWQKTYKLALLSLVLAGREMFNRKIDLKDIEIF